MRHDGAGCTSVVRTAPVGRAVSAAGPRHTRPAPGPRPPSGAVRTTAACCSGVSRSFLGVMCTTVMPSRSRCSRLRAYSDQSGVAPAVGLARGPGVQLDARRPARASRRPRRRGAGRRAGAGPRSTGVGQPVLAHHLVQPVLRHRPALGEQRVDGVHHVRAAQQPAPGSAPVRPRPVRSGRRGPPRSAAGVPRAASVSAATASARARGTGRDGHARSTCSGAGSRARARIAAAQPVDRSRRVRGTRTSIRSRASSGGRGGEAVQGERGQAR